MTKSTIALAFLSCAVALSANAQSDDRVSQLEKEVRELRARISRLESLLGDEGDAKELVASDDGWKSIANWRKLVTDMSTADVRKILGEPKRIDGGSVSHWYYPNGGRVTFFLERASSWTEPWE